MPHRSAEGRMAEDAGIEAAWSTDESDKEPEGPLDRALYNAVENRKHEEVERLLDEGANPNWANTDWFGGTALHTAALSGHTEVVRTLLARGAELEKGNEHGDTALHRAVLGNKVTAVRALIQAGANVHAKNTGGHTPLHFSDNKVMVEELVGAGASVAATDKDGRTALHTATAYCDHPEVVRTLLARGAELEKGDNYGRTALHRAVMGHGVATVKALTEAGANVHAKDKDGRTPLHCSESKVMVEVLVGAGASVTATDKTQRTPLHGVFWNFNLEEGTVQALVAAGADVHARDKDGSTALHFAAEDDTVEEIAELVAAGADLDCTDNAGSTALHIAAREGYLGKIAELVAAGADLDCTNNAGETPRDVATPEARLALDRARLAREQFEVQVPPDRVMLMFCGNGKVGKTTLTKALEHGKVDPSHPDGRTYGFDSFGAVIPHAGKCTMVDFGGQPEFWVPHGVFLGNRSGVYLVVINLGDAHSIQRSQLRHWLRFIASRSEKGTRPQVAVVGSHRGAAASIDAHLKEKSHRMTSQAQAEMVARIERLESVTAVSGRRTSAILHDTTQIIHTEFAKVLDVAPSPFLVESVDPDAMDTAELTRLQQWLGGAFLHIRQTRTVPSVCLEVASLITSHLRLLLPPITTYAEVMSALDEISGESIDFSDEPRNRAILSHLWESGHLMVFEGVGDTVVVDPQGFGVHIIGQLFCPHGDPDFQSLVVAEQDGYVFRRSQLEEHLARVRVWGFAFDDVHLALQLLTALELIIPLPATPETVDDPVFAIPGRLNQGDAILEKYRRRPADCWSEPRQFEGWAYSGVRLKLTSPLSLIPPSEFPRLQYRLSGKTGFQMWRHGLATRRCNLSGAIEVEGLVELNETMEHIDVCVRSEVGNKEACLAELRELVAASARVSHHFECGVLMAESLKSHVDTERHVAHGVGPGGGAALTPAAWLQATAPREARLPPHLPTQHNLSAASGGSAAAEAMPCEGSVGAPAANLPRHTKRRRTETTSTRPAPASSVAAVVSCPETASLTGNEPYDTNVFEHCERLRASGQIFLAFDRPRQPELGLRGRHPNDVDVIWSMGDPRLDGKTADEKWDAVQASVRGSFWFHGFRDRIKGAVLTLAQANEGRGLNLICIKGGPITNLEQQEMSIIANEVERELAEIKVRTRITLEYVSYSKFCGVFP